MDFMGSFFLKRESYDSENKTKHVSKRRRRSRGDDLVERFLDRDRSARWEVGGSCMGLAWGFSRSNWMDGLGGKSQLCPVLER